MTSAKLLLTEADSHYPGGPRSPWRTVQRSPELKATGRRVRMVMEKNVAGAEHPIATAERLGCKEFKGPGAEPIEARRGGPVPRQTGGR